ncbi:MAG: DNA-3-methyladenine glycosylase 2 family protein [Candidatus Curtissbacteria bacterium]
MRKSKPQPQTGYKAYFKRVDAKIYELALQINLELIVKPESYFERLCRTIVGQQLSGKVANVIFGRFEALLDGKVTPDAILKVSPKKMRAVGMSNSKVSFIKDLAVKVKSGEVDLEKIDELGDKEVVEHLVKVHGIGPWTAEMFLIFALARPDVFSTGDLGLLRGVERLYGIKNPSKKKLAQISGKWSPYRSFASRLLWKSLDNQ